MSLINSLLVMSLSIPQPIIPTKDDWQIKIDELFVEFEKTKNLPRKQKKHKRKRLDNAYSFYKAMQSYSGYDPLTDF